MQQRGNRYSFESSHYTRERVTLRFSLLRELLNPSTLVLIRESGARPDSAEKVRDMQQNENNSLGLFGIFFQRRGSSTSNWIIAWVISTSRRARKQKLSWFINNCISDRCVKFSNKNITQLHIHKAYKYISKTLWKRLLFYYNFFDKLKTTLKKLLMDACHFFPRTETDITTITMRTPSRPQVVLF